MQLEQNYESAKGVFVAGRANATKSDADLERVKQLVAKEDISRLQYDQAVATATANRAAVVSAQAGVHAAEQVVQQAQGKLLQSKNDLQTAETAPRADFADSRQRAGRRRPGIATKGSTCASRAEPQLYRDSVLP